MGKNFNRKKFDEEATAAKDFQEMLNCWKGFVRVPTVEIHNKLKYKVSLEKLFKPDEFKSLSQFEKKRIKNIDSRLSLMFVAGMPLPSENALRIKVGLSPRRKLICNNDSDSDADDDTWKPHRPKSTQSYLLNRIKDHHKMQKHILREDRRVITDASTGMTEYGKHQKFILMNLMVGVDGEKTDLKKCKEEMMRVMSSWTYNMLEGTDADRKIKKKVEKDLENKKDQLARCTTRGVRKDYTEPQVPDDDHYLREMFYVESTLARIINAQRRIFSDASAANPPIKNCDECDKLYEGECPTHGPYKLIPNTLVKWGLTDRARRTCPDGISVAPSKIRSGGLGVWADKDFPRNSVFGPYEGVDVHRLDVQKLRLLFEGGCAWEIYRGGELSHYIDGSDMRRSNWLRYINCARNEEEQNLMSYQYKKMIYYRAYKDISKGMELLVWYGTQYAEQLGITENKRTEKVQQVAFKIPDYHFNCEKCGSLFANEEALKRHTKAKHCNRSVMKRHKCEFCSYSSDHKHSVERHTRTHTKEKPFACSMCSKKFVQKGSLDCHFRSHTGECPYECNVCGKKFNQLSNLKQHIRSVHDKCKSFVCKVCGCTFGRSGDLKIHMTTHTGVRNYKCQYCDKRFARSDHLRAHERIHTGEKPYKCEECFVAFTHSTSLRYHVITHHTKRYPHRCSVCKKEFLCPKELKNHEARCKS